MAAASPTRVATSWLRTPSAHRVVCAAFKSKVAASIWSKAETMFADCGALKLAVKNWEGFFLAFCRTVLKWPETLGQGLRKDVSVETRSLDITEDFEGESIEVADWAQMDIKATLELNGLSIKIYKACAPHILWERAFIQAFVDLLAQNKFREAFLDILGMCMVELVRDPETEDLVTDLFETDAKDADEGGWRIEYAQDGLKIGTPKGESSGGKLTVSLQVKTKFKVLNVEEPVRREYGW